MTWTSRFKLWGGVLAVLLVTALLTLLFNQRQNSVNSFTATVDAPSIYSPPVEVEQLPNPQRILKAVLATVA